MPQAAPHGPVTISVSVLASTPLDPVGIEDAAIRKRRARFLPTFTETAAPFQWIRTRTAHRPPIHSTPEPLRRRRTRPDRRRCSEFGRTGHLHRAGSRRNGNYRRYFLICKIYQIYRMIDNSHEMTLSVPVQPQPWAPRRPDTLAPAMDRYRILRGMPGFLALPRARLGRKSDQRRDRRKKFFIQPPSRNE